MWDSGKLQDNDFPLKCVFSGVCDYNTGEEVAQSLTTTAIRAKYFFSSLYIMSRNASLTLNVNILFLVHLL